jgi:hypothetical protein
MTVATQVQQALATAKSVQADFEIFSAQTQDEVAKGLYAKAANEMEAVVEGLERRLQEIRQQEPEYCRENIDEV